MVCSLLFAACQSVQTQTSHEQSEPEVVINVRSVAKESPTPAPQTRPRQQSYNSVPIQEPYVAMTFDDGPHPTLTPQLLDILKKRNIRATFYVLGRLASEYPDIVRRMVEEGHEVGNHTWSHPYLTKLSSERVRSELEKTNDAVFKATGRRPATMRPPYGAINATLRKRFAEDMGMPVIMWSVDPLDWRRPGPSVVASRIVNGAHPGAIILAHDIHPGTIQAMPQALDQLLAKGYKFVTVSELIAMGENPRPRPTPSLDSREALEVVIEAEEAAPASPTPAQTPEIRFQNE